MKPIRKNASLESVAMAAVNRANRARRLWHAAVESVERTEWRDPNLNTYKYLRSLAWDRYEDLREIAEHLSRLTGVPGPRPFTEPA